MKKMPITIRLVLTTTLLIAGMLAIYWVLNRALLPMAYQYMKVGALETAYGKIADAIGSDSIGKSSFDVEFERICVYDNLNIIVYDPGHQVVRTSTKSVWMMQDQLEEIVSEKTAKGKPLAEETGRYRVQKMYDPNVNQEYLILWGTYEDGSSVFARTPVSSINRVTRITSNFLAVIAVPVILIGIFSAIIAARDISAPLKVLTELSRRMTHLDFAAKYDPKSSNSREMYVLGEHMNQMSEQLEKKIAELKVANFALEKDIRKKEELDEFRKDFISNVSHELKTPLSLISGYAEGLKEGIGEDDAELRNFYCDVIIDESEKMNRTVLQLLNLNRLEYGANPVDFEKFDLTELIGGLLLTQRLLAEQSDILLVFDETAPEYIWADAFQVEQVVTNYLTNAIHHAKNEKVIKISYRKAGNLLRLSVFNTGDPIPEESLGRIWEKFYKVDQARTREYGGTGIGLSIVKAIMNSLRRECGVINHEDGVEFWCEFERYMDSA